MAKQGYALRINSLLALSLCLAACAPATGTPAPATGAAPAPTPTSAGALLTTPAGTAPATPTIPGPDASRTEAPNDLGVVILWPEDGTVVPAPEVEFIGLALPETVITLNDEIVVVDGTGEFLVVVPLELGPNLIQVTASDVLGNVVEFELIVTYEPPV